MKPFLSTYLTTAITSFVVDSVVKRLFSDYLSDFGRCQQSVSQTVGVFVKKRKG
jgi:hypothetical protein